MSLRIGIDIGSTTVKVVVLDEQNKLLFRSYERHYSKTRERACETLRSISDMLSDQQVKMVITGSAGSVRSGVSFSTSLIRRMLAMDILIMTTTMESIIRLISRAMI